MKALVGFVSGKAAFWFRDGCLLAVSSPGGRIVGAPWGLFYDGMNPIHEAPSS